MSRSSRALALLTAAVLLPGLASCTATVSMEPARLANDPACAEIVSRLPDSLSGQERRWTDAQGTGAWGSPTSVLMTCGLEDPAPSTLPCRDFEGVDWLVDESQAEDDRYTITTFGHSPAIQVFFDYQTVSSADVAQALGSLVQRYTADTGRSCTARPGEEATPTPDAGS
ncbi:DUF3515 family protein [Microbacterium enclense]|uniref:DUF3515 family protein n=1 Tax=Microbacterium enclense TaxID=993073 RepID=UPI0036DDAB27